MSYQELLAPPQEYSSGNIISRLVDSLGFRYYWATEGLTEKDLAYKPSEEAMSSYVTIEHIYWLSIIIANAPKKATSVRLTADDLSKLTFNELKEKTLDNFKKTSDVCVGRAEKDFENFKIIIQGQDGSKKEFPFWNLIHGPISDALYHIGQIVSFRRTTGNPINSNVKWFFGKVDN